MAEPPSGTGGPDWYQRICVYQHEVHGRFIVPTIVREGADLIDLAHIFRFEVAKNRSLRVRKAWAERCKRRQAKGEPQQPPGGAAAGWGQGGLMRRFLSASRPLPT